MRRTFRGPERLEWSQRRVDERRELGRVAERRDPADRLTGRGAHFVGIRRRSSFQPWLVA
jgi:hypothetical protein